MSFLRKIWFISRFMETSRKITHEYGTSNDKYLQHASGASRNRCCFALSDHIFQIEIRWFEFE